MLPYFFFFFSHPSSSCLGMGRTVTRLPSFCLNRIRPHGRVRSPPVQSKQHLDPIKTDTRPDKFGNVRNENQTDGEKPAALLGRKIMIVVDSSFEAKGALQWALSHTVQSQDTIILLHVTKPSKHGQTQFNALYCSSYF